MPEIGNWLCHGDPTSIVVSERILDHKVPVDIVKVEVVVHVLHVSGLINIHET